MRIVVDQSNKGKKLAVLLISFGAIKREFKVYSTSARTRIDRYYLRQVWSLNAINIS
jgi:hypothetical protein